jgi:hypothetical protein
MSLRESTRAAAMRRARTCYDHLADRLAAAVRSHPHELGPAADVVFGRLGVDLSPLLERAASARPLLRFCVDWSEQRHHLAGALGAAVLARTDGAGWVVRRPDGRALEVTERGRRALSDALGVQDVA